MLENDELSSTDRDHIGSALTSASAMIGVVTQLLEFYKLQASLSTGMSIELGQEEFTLGQLSADLVDIAGPKAVARGVELVVDVDPVLLHLPLIGDAFRLRQVLINCADNGERDTLREKRRVVSSMPRPICQPPAARRTPS